MPGSRERLPNTPSVSLCDVKKSLLLGHVVDGQKLGGDGTGIYERAIDRAADETLIEGDGVILDAIYGAAAVGDPLGLYYLQRLAAAQRTGTFALSNGEVDNYRTTHQLLDTPDAILGRLMTEQQAAI